MRKGILLAATTCILFMSACGEDNFIRTVSGTYNNGKISCSDGSSFECSELLSNGTSVTVEYRLVDGYEVPIIKKELTPLK